MSKNVGPFDGPGRVASDLRVGEIRALRTFQVSGDGSLFPVWSGIVPWSDGVNTAQCKRGGHTPAAPGCSCGFYAYGTLAAASQHAEAKRVLAVVTCWGRVVPGTLGLRAQYARIEALWVSFRFSRGHVARVRRRYPSVAFYHSRRKMIRRHRPTRLDTYERPTRRGRDRSARRKAERAEALTGCLIYGYATVVVVLFLIAIGVLIRALLLWLVHAF